MKMETQARWLRGGGVGQLSFDSIIPICWTEHFLLLLQRLYYAWIAACKGPPLGRAKRRASFVLRPSAVCTAFERFPSISGRAGMHPLWRPCQDPLEISRGGASDAQMAFKSPRCAVRARFADHCGARIRSRRSPLLFAKCEPRIAAAGRPHSGERSVHPGVAVSEAARQPSITEDRKPRRRVRLGFGCAAINL